MAFINPYTYNASGAYMYDGAIHYPVDNPEFDLTTLDWATGWRDFENGKAVPLTDNQLNFMLNHPYAEPDEIYFITSYMHKPVPEAMVQKMYGIAREAFEENKEKVHIVIRSEGVEHLLGLDLHDLEALEKTGFNDSLRCMDGYLTQPGILSEVLVQYYSVSRSNTNTFFHHINIILGMNDRYNLDTYDCKQGYVDKVVVNDNTIIY